MATLADLFAGAVREAQPRRPMHSEQMEQPQPPPAWLTYNPVPEGWMPPGARYNRPPPPRPANQFNQNPKPAPRFHVPPGKELKARGLDL
jgi:hypothetical protein